MDLCDKHRDDVIIFPPPLPTGLTAHIKLKAVTKYYDNPDIAKNEAGEIMQGYVDKHEEWQLLQDRSLDYKQKISAATDRSIRVLLTLWLSIGAIIFTTLV